MIFLSLALELAWLSAHFFQTHRKAGYWPFKGFNSVPWSVERESYPKSCTLLFQLARSSHICRWRRLPTYWPISCAAHLVRVMRGVRKNNWAEDDSYPIDVLQQQGRPGTARHGGPADLWHGPARKILARKNIGTARHGKYWHGKIMARHVPKKYHKIVLLEK